jgi:hypothetical protein
MTLYHGLPQGTGAHADRWRADECAWRLHTGTNESVTACANCRRA